MAKSLQEQLLDSGAAKPKQAKKARREKTRQVKAARREGQTPPADAELAQDIEAQAAAKRDHDRRLNAEREAQREARERDESVAQILAQHRIAPAGDNDAGVIYNYTVDGRIRRLAVSDAQRRNLAAGRLAIVRHRGQASLVDADTARRLQQIVPDHVWLADTQPNEPDPDDPYADYVVPDDLMW